MKATMDLQGPVDIQYSTVHTKVQFFDPMVVRYFTGCCKQPLVKFTINQIRIINPPVVSILVAVVVLDTRASPQVQCLSNPLYPLDIVVSAFLPFLSPCFVVALSLSGFLSGQKSCQINSCSFAVYPFYKALEATKVHYKIKSHEKSFKSSCQT